MALPPELSLKLKTAIETDSLVFLCGAGLSIPSPSFLPPALAVARRAFDQWSLLEPMDPALRDDLDRLAAYFWDKGDFASTFLDTLVAWDELVGPPNAGHATIADFLICKAARAALSANFDNLIEQWAHQHKIDLRGALTGHEAVVPAGYNPLVKFHGCMHLDRSNTIWTKKQIAAPPVRDRVQSCAEWINLNLPDTHLVVVGFWSDWGYLNEALAAAFSFHNARSVTVFDPSDATSLQNKAPELWATLTGLSRDFTHVTASGSDALDELRTEFSRVWASRYFDEGRLSLVAFGGTMPVSADAGAMDGPSLYDLRCDAEGIPYNRAATQKRPLATTAHSSLLYLRLLAAGGTPDGSWIRIANNTVRVVNGAGRALDQMMASYREPVSVRSADVIVAAGAFDIGLPPRIVAAGRGESVVRPKSGTTARWLTADAAEMEFTL